MSDEHASGCLICGSSLVYLTGEELMECVFCGKQKPSNARCEKGHFICDACHAESAVNIIRNICLNSSEKDPIVLARHIMCHDSVKMHGPEHHFLVPAVMLAAYYNTKGEGHLVKKKILQAEARSKNILGGFCGFYGSCGAAIGTGIFISLITDATPLSVEEWKLANLSTALSLKVIAESGGPRCCKRDTFIAIRESVAFIREYFAMEMTCTEDPVCTFYPNNKECKFENCVFYPERS